MSRPKKKKSKRPGNASAATPRPAQRRVTLKLRELELDAGHDGLLRGAPEPCLLLALYSHVDRATTLLGRAIGRFEPRGRYPLTVPVRGDVGVQTRLRGPPSSTVVVLCVALEQDGGDDVGRVYELLAEPEAISTWNAADSVPRPSPMGGHEASDPERVGCAAVELLHGSSPIRDGCASDEWIAAGVFSRALNDVGVTEHRLRFRSADGANDWTGLFELQIK